MEIGQRIGPYEIRQPLGQGGMAQVWKAWHTGLHRFEALKIPAPPREEGAVEGASVGRAFIARFLKEARTAAGLHHPHIATIYAVSEADAPQPFFAMELIEGGDLAGLLHARGKLSMEEAIAILEPIARALDYAHGRGVVHRDIKPGNVLLEAQGPAWSPKVVDFGIARAAQVEDGAGQTALTQAGAIVGTPEYMSPEQAGSGEAVDHRSDIYSLGIMAYEMLCGRPPFSAAQGQSPISILVQHLRDLPPAPSTWRPDLPAPLSDALSWALAKQPGQRPASCSIFVQALSEAASGAAASTSGVAQASTATGPIESVPTLPGVIATQPTIPPGVAASNASAGAAPTMAPGQWAGASPSSAPPTVSGGFPSAPRVPAQPVGHVQGPAQVAQPRKPVWLLPAGAGALAIFGLAAVLAMGGLGRSVAPTATPMATAPSAPGTSGAKKSEIASASKTPQASKSSEMEPSESLIARKAQAEDTAQKARRLKSQVQENLLLLRKRKSQGLLSDEEADKAKRQMDAQMAQGLKLCEAALKLDANNETAWEQKAILLYQSSRYEESRVVAEQGIKRFPGNTVLPEVKRGATERLNKPLERST